jgi:elongation factor G
MREYRSESIRNVAVVGHGASGKTTLVDALAFASGSSRKHGSIGGGDTLTDTTPEEVARGYSISLGCAFAEWKGSKLNLIDTPGFLDFEGDAIAGLSAADGALVAIGATTGVEAGTERMFRAAIARNDPVLFVVAMMDKEHADFDAAYRSIRERLTTRVVPIEIPIGAGPGFRGIVNLFTKKATIFEAGAGGGKAGEPREVDVPAAERERVARYHQEMVEAIASTDDRLLERFFSDEELPGEDELAALERAMKRGELFPLLCCSSQLGHGVKAVLDLLVALVPSAREMEELHALRGAEGSATVEVHPDDGAPLVAQVFKTIAEAHVGTVSYFRTFSGTLESGAEVWNATRATAEKMGHLAVPLGRERIEVARLFPGDIGCVAKLRNTHTGDTLSTREHPVRMPEIPFPDPRVELAVKAATRTDEDRLQLGLHRLHDEDPTFQTHFDPETHETIVSGLGERHVEVAMARLARQFAVTASLAPPSIPYRETITASAEGQGRHKKQTGGRGQFGDCWVRMRPAPRGAGYAFVDAVVGGVIPRQWVPAVDKGIQEAAVRGVLAGFPVIDFVAECFDGSHHSVDSSEASFKMAGILAFKNVASKCAPVLLEPLDLLEVTTPDAHVGDVLGDLRQRRAHVLATEAAGEGGATCVRAIVPRAELHLYATQLSSITRGRGTFTHRFHAYDLLPAELASKVIAAAASRRGDGGAQPPPARV